MGRIVSRTPPCMRSKQILCTVMLLTSSMLIADEFAATNVQNQISVDTTFKVCK
jgi:hypothetical protein